MQAEQQLLANERVETLREQCRQAKHNIQPLRNDNKALEDHIIKLQEKMQAIRYTDPGQFGALQIEFMLSMQAINGPSESQSENDYCDVIVGLGR